MIHDRKRMLMEIAGIIQDSSIAVLIESENKPCVSGEGCPFNGEMSCSSCAAAMSIICAGYTKLPKDAVIIHKQQFMGMISPEKEKETKND